MIRAALAATLIAAPAWSQSGADIVVLGEIHDSAAAHARQAELVAQITPTALVFEMLTPEQAAGAKNVDRLDAEELGRALAWDDTAWPDFTLYAPIFAAAPQAAVIGAAVPREALSGIVRGTEEPDTSRLPELDEAALADLLTQQDDAHCGMLPARMLPGMVAAQRMRDRAFADAALAALAEFGPPVVVIAGTGHARRDTGIPAMVAVTDPQVQVWSLGQVEAGTAGAGRAGASFDALEIVPVVDRPDPCAAFAPAE